MKGTTLRLFDMLTPADIEFIVANEGADVTRLLLAATAKGRKGNASSGKGNAALGGGNAASGGGNATPGKGNAALGGRNATPGGKNAAPGGKNAELGGGNAAPGGNSACGVNIPLCCKCIQAREKMKVKAPLWYRNPSLAYPFAVSVEQGSSQATALFKQSIIAGLMNSTPDTLSGNHPIFPNENTFCNDPSGNHPIFPNENTFCNIPSGNAPIFPNENTFCNDPSGNQTIFPNENTFCNIPSGNTPIFPNENTFCNDPSGNQTIFPNENTFCKIPSGNHPIFPNGKAEDPIGKNTIITADLTGGMGIDSFFISRIASKHYYFERNAELCAATEYNFRQLGAGNIEVSNRDITADDCAVLRELQGKGVSLIYIDPARRTASGGKAILLQDYEPNVIELQERLFAVSRYILVKVSPMADIKLNLRHLPCTSAVYVVAVGNECKELLFLLDREHNGVEPPVYCFNVVLLQKKLNNSILDNQNSGNSSITKICNTDYLHVTQKDIVKISEEEAAEATYAKELGKYLYEPGKAILKSGAYKLISKRYGCRKLAPSTHLYTSDETIPDFPGKAFMVEEVVPFNKKSLKEVAARHPKADLTARNFPMDTNALKKLSGIKDGGERHIFAATLSNGEKILVITLPVHTTTCP